jgi:hypothetical protein
MNTWPKLFIARATGAWRTPPAGVRETCNCVFRHAVETGIIKVSENPALDPKVGGVRTPSVTHYAAITKPEAWDPLSRAIRAYKGTPMVRAALQFPPRVFRRPGHVRAAEWDRFDLLRPVDMSGRHDEGAH